MCDGRKVDSRSKPARTRGHPMLLMRFSERAYEIKKLDENYFAEDV